MTNTGNPNDRCFYAYTNKGNIVPCNWIRKVHDQPIENAQPSHPFTEAPAPSVDGLEALRELIVEWRIREAAYDHGDIVGECADELEAALTSTGMRRNNAVI